MNYLMIQNPGEAPVEGYTLLGLSTTRDCGVAGTSGQFGSGAKHAINVLLRAGIKFFIYCGKTRLEFSTKEEVINDGLVKKTVAKVVCRLGGTSTKLIDCGWCLDFGVIDWNETAMAIREFVSNALDRTIRQEGDFFEPMAHGELAVIPQTAGQRQAKEGYTRIYIEMTPEVHRYFAELPKRFLHFSSDPSQVSKSILPKADRNIGCGSMTPMIYRCGILVREISDIKAPSLFDYNFTANELTIDECRNSSEYATRAACARLVRRADKDALTTVFKSLSNDETTFESELDTYYLLPTYENATDEEKETWQDAWAAANGRDTVMCDSTSASATQVAETVKRKGHKVAPIKSRAFAENVERFGIKTAGSVLSSNEQKGRDEIPATPAAIEATKIVWGWIDSLGMTQGKPMPETGCFRDIMSGECATNGYQSGNGVYYREDHASEVTKFLLKVAFEECVHYVTDATDNSRDFQNFLIDCFVEVAA